LRKYSFFDCTMRSRNCGVRTALATGFRLCLRRSIIGLLLYVTNYKKGLTAPGRLPWRDVLQHCGQGQGDIARRANASPAARLVVAAFENPVQFDPADAALVQQRNGGMELGRGQKRSVIGGILRPVFSATSSTN
jgi:hypothetical protein